MLRLIYRGGGVRSIPHVRAISQRMAAVVIMLVSVLTFTNILFSDASNMLKYDLWCHQALHGTRTVYQTNDVWCLVISHPILPLTGIWLISIVRLWAA